MALVLALQRPMALETSKRIAFVPLFQLTSRDSELDSVKDRYNAALKEASDVNIKYYMESAPVLCLHTSCGVSEISLVRYAHSFDF